MKSKLTVLKVVLLLVCLLINSIANGLLSSMGVLFAELVDVFDAPRSKAVLIQGLFVSCLMLAGILWTGVLRKFGTGIPVMCGSLISCAGLLASSFSPNLEVITVCTGLISGIGTSVFNIACAVSTCWIFHEDPGFPLALVSIGSSIGQVPLPYFTDIFITLYTWSGAFQCLAGLALQGVPCGLLLHVCRDMFDYDKSKNSVCSVNEACDVRVFKDAAFVIFLATALLLPISVTVEVYFIVDHAVSLGFSREQGTFLLTINNIANLIGRILGSCIRYKCSTMPAVFHVLYLMPIIAVGHILILFCHGHYYLLIVACAIHGIGFGFTNSLIMVIVYESTNHDLFPQAMALVFVCFGISRLIFNIFGGTIRDIFGGYDVVYYISIGGTFLIAVLSAIILRIELIRKKRKEGVLCNGTGDVVKYETFK